MFFGNRNNKNLLTLRPRLIFYGNAPLFNTSCIRFTNPFNYYSAVTVSVSFVHYHSLYPVFLPRNGGIERVYVDFVYEAFRETPCEISGVIAVAIEVTSQVMARKKIEEAEERARMAIESADLGTYEINLLTDEMKTSDRFNEIWGVTHNISRAEFCRPHSPG